MPKLVKLSDNPLPNKHSSRLLTRRLNGELGIESAHKKDCIMYKPFLVFFLLSLVALSGCSSDTDTKVWLDISESQYGESWPFPEHPSGRLNCQIANFGGVDRPLVLVELGSTTYGLNGAAMGVGGYPDARTQMAQHPEYGTYELGASSDLIDLAQDNCT